MPYKTILVHFNDEPRFAGLMRAAVQIAGANEARIIGLAVMPPIILTPRVER